MRAWVCTRQRHLCTQRHTLIRTTTDTNTYTGRLRVARLWVEVQRYAVRTCICAHALARVRRTHIRIRTRMECSVMRYAHVYAHMHTRACGAHTYAYARAWLHTSTRMH